MVMLRLRLSWMRWRRSRKEARLEREERRLRMLQRLQAEQLMLLRRLERELHPLLEPVMPEPEPEPVRPPPPPEPPSPVESQQVMLVPEPAEMLEPMPDPVLEIARRIGLPQPPT